MNEKEKEEFVTALIKKCKEDILKEIPIYPDEWNGIELRERIKDVYSQVIIGKMDRKRKMEYNNFCIVNNLR